MVSMSAAIKIETGTIGGSLSGLKRSTSGGGSFVAWGAPKLPGKRQ